MYSEIRKTQRKSEHENNIYPDDLHQLIFSGINFPEISLSNQSKDI